MKEINYEGLNAEQIERVNYLRRNISVLEKLKDEYLNEKITEIETNKYIIANYNNLDDRTVKLVIDDNSNTFDVCIIENGNEEVAYSNFDIYTYSQYVFPDEDNQKILEYLEELIQHNRYRKQSIEDKQKIYNYFNSKGISKEAIDRIHTYLVKSQDNDRIVLENNTDEEKQYRISLNDNSIEIPESDVAGKNKDETYRIRKGLNCEHVSDKDTIDMNIFVCDNIFNALKLESIGKKAISIDGIEFLEEFFNYIDFRKAFDFNYILCLEDNKDIRNFVEKVLQYPEIKKNNISVKKIYIPEEYETINDWYEKNRDIFNVTFQSISDDNMFLYLKNGFKQDIKEFIKHSDLSTGFKNLDKIINGIRPGLYVLGAIPSLGKTTLMHQMADNLAKNGQKVLFFSMEQGKLELIAKSISRLTYTSKELAKRPQNTLQIMKSSSFNRDVRKAIEEYEGFASNICIIKGEYDTNIQNIKKYIEQYIRFTGEHPVIIIDYLQIISSINENQAERQSIDENVRILYELAHKNNLPVFVVCSVSRVYYDKPIDMTAFKESGGIEYGADVLMGLQLQKVHELDGVGNKNEVLGYAKAEVPRKIELVVIKSKISTSYGKCYFNYYAEYNYFEETEQFKQEGTNNNGRGFELDNKNEKNDKEVK